jgi:hypothetical protein
MTILSICRLWQLRNRVRIFIACETTFNNQEDVRDSLDSSAHPRNPRDCL